VTRIARPLRTALALLVGAAYLALGHLTASSDDPPLIGVLAGLLALGSACVAMAWKSRARVPLLLLGAAALLALVLGYGHLRAHAAWLYFVQHVGAMGALFVAFGSTLRGTHAQALCSRIALFVAPGTLDADYLRYTWRVTLAWTVFFGAMGAASVLLFFFGPVEVWSVLANIATPILLGVMFVGEYLIRRAVLPTGGDVGITATIRAFMEYTRKNPSRTGEGR